MATTTNLSQVNGALLTWGNQTLLWSDSLTGLRTWAVSYNTIAYTMAVGETVAFAESGSRKPFLEWFESFSVAENRQSSFGLNPVEVLDFVDSNTKSITQRLAETLVIGELPGNTLEKFFSEAFDLAESYKKSYTLAKDESIAFDEAHVDSVGFIRNFQEVLNVDDAVTKVFGLKKSELLKVADAWRRQADMVISDMMVVQENMDMTGFMDFMKYGNVPGYEKWRDFIPGDYEYREAMFRVVLESKNADRGLLTTLQATVDVPDVIDRGSATVTVAELGAVVTYNRPFHVTPEITLAARSGTGANPIAPELFGVPTKNSFTVRLRDTVTGAYVTGTFTWAAHGY